jgi:hypothetical protein
MKRGWVGVRVVAPIKGAPLGGQFWIYYTTDTPTATVLKHGGFTTHYGTQPVESDSDNVLDESDFLRDDQSQGSSIRSASNRDNVEQVALSPSSPMDTLNPASPTVVPGMGQEVIPPQLARPAMVTQYQTAPGNAGIILPPGHPAQMYVKDRDGAMHKVSPNLVETRVPVAYQQTFLQSLEPQGPGGQQSAYTGPIAVASAPPQFQTYPLQGQVPHNLPAPGYQPPAAGPQPETLGAGYVPAQPQLQGYVPPQTLPYPPQSGEEEATYNRGNAQYVGPTPSTPLQDTTHAQAGPPCVTGEQTGPWRPSKTPYDTPQLDPFPVVPEPVIEDLSARLQRFMTATKTDRERHFDRHKRRAHEQMTTLSDNYRRETANLLAHYRLDMDDLKVCSPTYRNESDRLWQDLDVAKHHVVEAHFAQFIQAQQQSYVQHNMELKALFCHDPTYEEQFLPSIMKEVDQVLTRDSMGDIEEAWVDQAQAQILRERKEAVDRQANRRPDMGETMTELLDQMNHPDSNYARREKEAARRTALKDEEIRSLEPSQPH